MVISSLGYICVAQALALTLPEVRHLLAQLMWPYARSARRILAWSWWHSFHRGIASYYHTKRRLKAS